MELAEACSGTDDREAGSGIPADFPAACVYFDSHSADSKTSRCQAIAVAAKCRADDLCRKAARLLARLFLVRFCCEKAMPHNRGRWVFKRGSSDILWVDGSAAEPPTK